MVIAQGFGKEFLSWLQTKTEVAWRHYKTQDFARKRQAGVDWRPGTRWLADLSNVDVLRIEQRWNSKFPLQHQLFLRYLHALDRPMVRARFGEHGIRLEPETGFYNWQQNEPVIAETLLSPLQGVLFDVQVNNLWIPSWGNQPSDVTEKARVVTELVTQAPKLIPLVGHRYVVDATHVDNSFVLSVNQTDIVVFASDVRTFLLNEFRALLQLDASITIDSRYAHELQNAANLPFWGELIRRRAAP
jgi:hypothetical protein